MRQCPMFARGEVSRQTAHPPVQKSLAAKSLVSATSKPIENKGLQVYSFGHLRKTGGRGSYSLVHTGHPTKDVHPELAEGILSYSSILRLQPTPQSPQKLAPQSPKFNDSRTYEAFSSKSNYSRIYG